MQAQLEEVQARQRRNIREPIYARFPVVRTIDEVVESPEFQMGLMAAMMTANTFVPPNVGGLSTRLPGGTGASYDRFTGQGLYVLKDSDDVVRWVGRGDAWERIAAYARGPAKKHLVAQIVADSNLSYAEARGLEQLVMDHYGGALSQNPNTQLLSKIRGLSR